MTQLASEKQITEIVSEQAGSGPALEFPRDQRRRASPIGRLAKAIWLRKTPRPSLRSRLAGEAGKCLTRCREIGGAIHYARRQFALGNSSGLGRLRRYFFGRSIANASDGLGAVEEWNSECALAEKFQRLVAVKGMVEAGANVAEQPFERQPLEIRRPADCAKRQVDHAN